MWDELNRWWLGHRKPRPQPPEQLAVECPRIQRTIRVSRRADDVAEFENSLAPLSPADTPQTIKAEDPIQEPECVGASSEPSDSA